AASGRRRPLRCRIEAHPGLSRSGAWQVKRILNLAAIALLAEGIGGCAHTPPPEPAIRTVTVKEAVPVPCHADVTVKQSYSDEAAEFLTDIRDQVAALLQGRKERQADATRLTGGVVGCGGTVTAK